MQKLFPHLAGLRVEQVGIDGTGVTLVLVVRRGGARCPLCEYRSRAEHSRYARTLADLPVAGRAVRLRVRVRRFRCLNPACRRRIFAERFPQLAPDHARRTLGQKAALVELGFALGGSAGARLGSRLKLSGSRATILRLVHGAPTPAAPIPRVLGVDDWARKRGQTYGTILVDLERRCTVDLLGDRTSAGLSSWLKAHPGVEVISRDRSGAYAEGARQGAPEAVQVADRFHLIANAGDAFERVLLRHSSDLRAAAKAVAAATAEVTASAVPPVPRPPSRSEREARARRARRQARYDELHALSREGHSIRAIARHLHLSRTTVIKYLRADSCPHPGPRPNRRSLVDPWLPHLRERWAAGCRNAQELFRELKALGFPGGKSIVSARLAQWRTGPHRPGPYPAAEPAAAGAVPLALATATNYSPRRTRWLLLRDEADLPAEQRAYRDHLLARSPAIDASRALAQEFWRLVRERDGAALAPWRAKARTSGLPEFREFAAGIERDLDAVEAALRLEVSNGQTEGQITKLKLLKRASYGRAGLPLLRARLLRAA